MRCIWIILVVGVVSGYPQTETRIRNPFRSRQGRGENLPIYTENQVQSDENPDLPVEELTYPDLVSDSSEEKLTYSEYPDSVSYDVDLESSPDDLEAAPNDLDPVSSGSGIESLSRTIPGNPGQDYPIYSEAPSTSFGCDDKEAGGYYADPESSCQAFHICGPGFDGRMARFTFLCPNGTIFNQQYFICDWWFNVVCEQDDQLAIRTNQELARAREEATSARKETVRVARRAYKVEKRVNKDEEKADKVEEKADKVEERKDKDEENVDKVEERVSKDEENVQKIEEPVDIAESYQPETE